MTARPFAIALLLLGMFQIRPAFCADEPRPINTTRPGAGGGILGGGWGPYGNAAGGMHFEQFMATLQQLNMTPDFTLDKEAKQKLHAVREDFTKAQAKFMADNKAEFDKIGKEQVEAYKAKDMEKAKEIARKYQDIYATGPKSDEYVSKAKAALPPEQLKVVEDHLKKAEDERKAMMEKWRQREGAEGRQNPGAPAQEKK